MTTTDPFAAGGSDHPAVLWEQLCALCGAGPADKSDEALDLWADQIFALEHRIEAQVATDLAGVIAQIELLAWYGKEGIAVSEDFAANLLTGCRQCATAGVSIISVMRS